MAKEKPSKKDVTNEVNETTEEVAQEVTEEVTEETVAEKPVEAPVKEEPKAAAKAKDKYEESKKKDSDASFDVVKAILTDNDLTVDRKLERISEEAHVSYKSIIETFKEFDVATQGGTYIKNPEKYGQQVKGLYDVFRKVLDNTDTYVAMLQIEILMLLFSKYQDSSLTVTSVFAYGEAFGGSEAEYQDFVYIITTLGIFKECLASGKLEQVTKLIDFNRADFLHGKKLEEYYLNVLR